MSLRGLSAKLCQTLLTPPEGVLALMGKARGWASSRGEELEPLLEHTDLISVRWLRDLAAERRIIPAWQKLPTEAKAELKDMREWRGDGLPIGVLSYGWGGPDHPDPAGLQLQALLPVLSAIVTVCDTFSKNWCQGPTRAPPAASPVSCPPPCAI